jgi:ABC-type sugar transport system ATPase subunit
LPASLTAHDMVPVLAAEELSKRFYSIQALDRVSFMLVPGEIHALVGENGAGKSTLIKIFGGVYRPDSGRLLLDGQDAHFRSPADAFKAGIAIIQQELRLAPALSVAENVMLGHLPRGRFGTVDIRRTRKSAREALARLRFYPDLDAPAATLSFAERQSVAIARALSRDARVLILDEPTAALEDREVDSLFEVLARLRSQGVAMLYVSHRLEEIPVIADRCTVMRDGRIVAELPASGLRIVDLVVQMTGRSVHVVPSTPPCARGETLLEAEDLPEITLHAGRVTGLAGLLGSGTNQLLRRLFGATRGNAGAQRVRIRGRDVRLHHPAQAIAAGIGMVPSERTLGLVLGQTVRDNIVLPSLKRFGGLWRMNEEAVDRVVRELISVLDLRPNDPHAIVRSLSGGNQQKVVLAKWLAAKIDVLLLDEPTQGIDVAAKAHIHRLVREFVDKGGAVLFASSDMREMLALADSVLPMRNRRIVTRLDRGAGLTEQAVHDALSQ